jgi:hypothetical protein
VEYEEPPPPTTVEEMSLEKWKEKHDKLNASLGTKRGIEMVYFVSCLTFIC